MKIGGFKTATVTTNHQMQQSNRNPVGIEVGFGCHG